MVSLVLALVFGFVISDQPVYSDWGVSLGASYSTPYYGERISSNYRRGYQMDDWVERGASSVTESPIFSDGVRLSAWSTMGEGEDDYEYGIASAIYYFDLPRNTRSLKIKVYYDGESDRDDLNNDIAGRIWIRRATIGDDFEEYYPNEGRYENVDKPLYGDTFALPSKKHLEIIRISARDHIEDDTMELHVVAEGRQQIDVKYIEVESYSSEASIRVITRYYKDYIWRPWHNYTYWYFYSGPTFYFSDYYYVRYTYPHYRRYYVDVRRNYDRYLTAYYVRRPHYHVRWIDVDRVHKGAPRSWNKDRINRWTPAHNEARKGYATTVIRNRRTADVQASRERIRSVLSSSSRQSPTLMRIQSGRSVQTRGESVTEVKRRREDPTPQRVVTPDTRTRTQESQRTPSRMETRAQTENRNTPREVEKSRRENTKSSVRIRRGSTEQAEKRVPSRSENANPSVRENRGPNDQSRNRAPSKNEDNDAQLKKRREATRVETRKEEPKKVEKAPPKEQKKVEVKKDDNKDDDDEDKDKKDSGSSSTRKKIRSR